MEVSAVNESSKHKLRGTSPWLFAPPAPWEDTDLGFLGFPRAVPCYSFCAGFGSHRRAGPPWRARVSGCGAGARQACALPPAVPGAPLPPRPRVPDQTPVPARSQTTLLSCQFSRLSAELLVSDTKQRGGGKAAWLGRERPGGGAAGRPRAGVAGGAGVHGLRVGPPSPASAPPRPTPLPALPFSLSPSSPPLLPTRSSLSPPAVLQLPNCSLPWL